MEFRFSESKDATDWLSERLTEQRKALEASEAALQAYRERNGAVSVADSASNIVVQRLTDLNGALTKAKTERINKEALYNQLKAAETSGDSTPSRRCSPTTTSRNSAAISSDLQRQQAQLAERYGERHAEMIKIRTAIEIADAKLRGELGKVVASVKNEYQAAVGRGTQPAVGTRRAEDRGAQPESQRDRVRRAAARGREQQADLRKPDAAHQGNRHFRASARAPTSASSTWPRCPRAPISPNLRRSFMLAFVAGLTLSLGLVFFIDYLDSRLKTPQDLKAHLGVPFLGMIPAVPRKEAGNPLLTDVGVGSFSEAFKTVRTNVLFSSAEEGLRSLVVTSAGPGEGKSICSANIAIAMAQTGLRVLLVDADMRRPRVHEIFDDRGRARPVEPSHRQREGERGHPEVEDSRSVADVRGTHSAEPGRAPQLAEVRRLPRCARGSLRLGRARHASGPGRGGQHGRRQQGHRCGVRRRRGSDEPQCGEERHRTARPPPMRTCSARC